MVVNMTEGLYPDFVGRRQIFAGSGAGPASYTTGGDTVTLSNPRLYIDIILSGGMLTTDGTYYVFPIASGSGPRATWKLKWYAVGGTTEVAGGTNLSTKTLNVGGFCGQF
jgi:hypothetical protein